MHIHRILATVSLFGLAFLRCASTAGDRLIGSWGGDGAALVVTDERATVSYTCGVTTVTGPIAIGDDHTFEAAGEHQRAGGAQPRPGDPIERGPAHLAGRVTGRIMTLIIRLTDSDQTVGPFLLTRDGVPSILGCP